MRTINLLTLALLLLFGHAYAGVKKPCEAIRNYIFEKLPEYGVLKQDKEGFVYVDLPNDYIYKLVGLIEEDGFVEPDYFEGDGRVGAHISVVYASESERYNVGKIEEVGTTIYFRVNGCEIVQPRIDPEIDSYYLVTVDAPILAKIRKKYGLPPHKYPFHITVGVKYVEIDEETNATPYLDVEGEAA